MRVRQKKKKDRMKVISKYAVLVNRKCLRQKAGPVSLDMRMILLLIKALVSESRLSRQSNLLCRSKYWQMTRCYAYAMRTYVGISWRQSDRYRRKIRRPRLYQYHGAQCLKPAWGQISRITKYTCVIGVTLVSPHRPEIQNGSQCSSVRTSNFTILEIYLVGCQLTALTICVAR